MDAQSKKHIATSRWMTPDEVEQRFVHQANSFWMGRNATNSEEGIGFRDDRHIMLVSGNRGGKGVSVIVPNLCLWQGSLVVVDPKGENATLTAARRGQGSTNCTGLGQAVHVLDPMNVARVDDAYRASFNPLDSLDPSSPHVIDDATRIADAIVEIGQGESRQWDEGARSLVRTLLLHVLTEPRYEGRRNLVTVRRLILRGENEIAAKIHESAEQRGGQSSVSGHVILWDLARNNQALNGVIAASADSFLESAKNSPKQYNSYRLIAERSTEFLDSPGMATCVSSSSFRLADLKTDANGVSVYLALPQRFMSTHYRWLRMMIALTVTEMETVPGQPASGAPVLMVLDEFAGLRRMDIIENGVAQIAGFGVKMFFVLQSLEQLKSVYPDRWETFLANCGIRIFFATTDNFTNQYVSDALGEHEIVRTTRSIGRSTTDTSSTSDSFGESTSEQISTAKTRGDSSTTGRGGNTSKSRGGNNSRSQGTGTSESGSTGYGPEWFFAERTGRQSGEGSSTNSGSSYGKSWSDGMGRNWSRSNTRTSSTTRTQGTTTGTSRTSQTGTSQALGKNFGQSEQIFKKALITKDEMAKLFTRIDDPNHRAYPGLALINIAGEAPMLLRRTPYFSDPKFEKLFEPHPDHPYISISQQKEISSAAQIKPEWPRNHGAVILNTIGISGYPGEHLSPDAQLMDLAKRARKWSLPIEKKRYQTINAPYEIAKAFLLDLEAHQHWFRRPDPRIGSQIVPKELYTGCRIPSGFLWSAYDTDNTIENESFVDITPCFLSSNYNVPIFFRMKLYRRGNNNCELLIMKEWYDKPSPIRFFNALGIGQRGVFPRNSKHALDIDDDDLIPPDFEPDKNSPLEEKDDDLRSVAQAFKHACEDIYQYGAPSFSETSNYVWITAPRSGILHLYDDFDFGLPLEPGDMFDTFNLEGNILTFGEVENESSWKLRFRGKGEVIDIRKYPDGQIEKGDRIMKLRLE